jgi:parallel beta-helix repeat protein
MRHVLLRKSWSLGIIFLFFSAAVASSPSNSIVDTKLIIEGKTLYVGGSGPGNYSKIQDAIDNASNNDTVFVYDDSSPYYENIMIIEHSINLIGENRETTIIDGGEQLSVVSVQADGVVISGFTIQNSGILWINHGIDLHSSYSTISDNKITNNHVGIGLYTISSYNSDFNNITNNIIEKNHGYGVKLYGSRYNTISDNTIASNNGNGIYLAESFNNVISRNTISDNNGGLIISNPSNYNNASDNVFTNDGVIVSYLNQNTLLNNLANGKPIVYLEGESDKIIEEDVGQIILVHCNNITVHNQDLSNVSNALMLLDTHNCLITGNTISSNDVYGLFSSGSNGNNISKNIVSNNAVGMGFGTSDNNVIFSNIISSNPWYGINLVSSKNNTISRNTIENNGGRKRIEGGLGIWFYNSSYNIISHNNFLQNGRDAYSTESTSNNWNGNYWNRPRLLPKIIWGESAGGVPLFDIKLTFDWHPALKPYDIEV